MAAESGCIVRFIYRGERRRDIPRDVTHVIVKDTTFVRVDAFRDRRNIVEVIFQEDVERVKERAFADCRFLRRVIMSGIKVVEWWAFSG